MSGKRVPLNQNGRTANFRMGVPFERNLQPGRSVPSKPYWPMRNMSVMSFSISKWKQEYADLKEQRDTDYTKLKFEM